MPEIVDTIFAVLLHPYPLCVAGILVWELQRQLSGHKKTFRDRMGMVGSSMIWTGLLIAVDDEAVALLNQKFGLLLTLNNFFYFGAGFCIDIVRNKIQKDD